MGEVYARCAYMATAVRLWGTDTPVPVTVAERLVTRRDEKGRALAYVVLGVGPSDDR